MSSETFLAEKDVLGIVTQRRQDRARFARFTQHRPTPPPRSPSRLPPPPPPAVPTSLRDTVKQMVADCLAEMNQKRLEAIAAPVLKEGPTVVSILVAVTEATGYPVEDVLGPRCPRRLCRARQMAYHLLRVLRTDMSFPAIGRVMGRRDHTTIQSGLKKFEKTKGEEPLTTWMAHPAVVKLLAKE